MAATSSSIALQRGQLQYLEAAPNQLRKIVVNLGWESERRLDLDLVCLMFTDTGVYRQSVDFGHKAGPNGSMYFPRDDDGGKTGEIVIINVAKLPEHLTHLYFCVTGYSGANPFQTASRVFMRIFDLSNDTQPDDKARDEDGREICALEMKKADMRMPGAASIISVKIFKDNDRWAVLPIADLTADNKISQLTLNIEQLEKKILEETPGWQTRAGSDTPKKPDATPTHKPATPAKPTAHAPAAPAEDSNADLRDNVEKLRRQRESAAAAERASLEAEAELLKKELEDAKLTPERASLNKQDNDKKRAEIEQMWAELARKMADSATRDDTIQINNIRISHEKVLLDAELQALKVALAAAPANTPPPQAEDLTELRKAVSKARIELSAKRGAWLAESDFQAYAAWVKAGEEKKMLEAELDQLSRAIATKIESGDVRVVTSAMETALGDLREKVTKAREDLAARNGNILARIDITDFETRKKAVKYSAETIALEAELAELNKTLSLPPAQEQTAAIPDPNVSLRERVRNARNQVARGYGVRLSVFENQEELVKFEREKVALEAELDQLQKQATAPPPPAPAGVSDVLQEQVRELRREVTKAREALAKKQGMLLSEHHTDIMVANVRASEEKISLETELAELKTQIAAPVPRPTVPTDPNVELRQRVAALREKLAKQQGEWLGQSAFFAANSQKTIWENERAALEAEERQLSAQVNAALPAAPATDDPNVELRRRVAAKREAVARRLGEEQGKRATDTSAARAVQQANERLALETEMAELDRAAAQITSTPTPAELEQQAQANAALRKQTDEKRRELATRDGQATALRARAAAVEAEHVALKAELTSLVERAQQAPAAGGAPAGDAAADPQIKTLEDANTALREQIKATRVQLAAAEGARQAKIDEAKQRRQQISNERYSLEAELTEINRQFQENREHQEEARIADPNVEIRKQVLAARKELARFDGELLVSRGKKMMYDTERASLDSQLAALQETMKNRPRLDDLDDPNLALRTEVTMARHELNKHQDKLREQLERAAQRKLLFTSEKQELEAEMIELREKMKASSAPRIEDVPDPNVELRKQLEALRSELARKRGREAGQVGSGVDPGLRFAHERAALEAELAEIEEQMRKPPPSVEMATGDPNKELRDHVIERRKAMAQRTGLLMADKSTEEALAVQTRYEIEAISLHSELTELERLLKLPAAAVAQAPPDPNVELRATVLQLRAEVARRDGERAAASDDARNVLIRFSHEQMALAAEAEILKARLAQAQAANAAPAADPALNALREEVTKLRREAARLDGQVLADQSRAALVEKQKLALGAEKVELERQLGDLANMLASMKNAGGTLAQQIQELRAAVTAAREELARRELAVLGTRSRDLASAAEAEALRVELAALNKQKAAMETPSEPDKDPNAALRSEVARLRHEVAAKQDLDALTSQRSRAAQTRYESEKASLEQERSRLQGLLNTPTPTIPGDPNAELRETVERLRLEFARLDSANFAAFTRRALLETEGISLRAEAERLAALIAAANQQAPEDTRLAEVNATLRKQVAEARYKLATREEEMLVMTERRNLKLARLQNEEAELRKEMATLTRQLDEKPVPVPEVDDRNADLRNAVAQRRAEVMARQADQFHREGLRKNRDALFMAERATLETEFRELQRVLDELAQESAEVPDPNVQLRAQVLALREKLARREGEKLGRVEAMRTKQILWEKEKIALEAELAGLQKYMGDMGPDVEEKDPNDALRQKVHAARVLLAEREAARLDREKKASLRRARLEMEELRLGMELNELQKQLNLFPPTETEDDAIIIRLSKEVNDLRISVTQLHTDIARREGESLTNIAERRRAERRKLEGEQVFLQTELRELEKRLAELERTQAMQVLPADDGILRLALQELNTQIRGTRERLATVYAEKEHVITRKMIEFDARRQELEREHALLQNELGDALAALNGERARYQKARDAVAELEDGLDRLAGGLGQTDRERALVGAVAGEMERNAAQADRNLRVRKRAAAAEQAKRPVVEEDPDRVPTRDTEPTEVDRAILERRKALDAELAAVEARLEQVRRLQNAQPAPVPAPAPAPIPPPAPALVLVAPAPTPMPLPTYIPTVPPATSYAPRFESSGLDTLRPLQLGAGLLHDPPIVGSRPGAVPLPSAAIAFPHHARSGARSPPRASRSPPRAPRVSGVPTSPPPVVSTARAAPVPTRYTPSAYAPPMPSGSQTPMGASFGSLPRYSAPSAREMPVPATPGDPYGMYAARPAAGAGEQRQPAGMPFDTLDGAPPRPSVRLFNNNYWPSSNY